MPLQVGDLVYARVTAADRDLEPVLACTDAQGKVSSSVSLDIAQFLQDSAALEKLVSCVAKWNNFVHSRHCLLHIAK